MQGIEIKPAKYMGWTVRILTAALGIYSAFAQADDFALTFFVGPTISTAFVWRYLAKSGRCPSALWCLAFVPYFFYFLLNPFMPISFHPLVHTTVLIGFAFLVLVAPTKHSGILHLLEPRQA